MCLVIFHLSKVDLTFTFLSLDLLIRGSSYPLRLQGVIFPISSLGPFLSNLFALDPFHLTFSTQPFSRNPHYSAIFTQTEEDRESNLTL